MFGTEGRIRSLRRQQLLVACNVRLFCISSIFFSLALVYLREYFNIASTRNGQLKATNAYSPLLDYLDIPLSTVRVNGTPRNTHNSIYRQPPSPEVDAAWERLANLTPTILGTEEVIALGKDPSKTARYPLSFGFGPEAHIGELDMTHQFHCLDMLRREIDFDFYYGARYPDGVRPERHRVHTSHRLSIILQHLMCTASTDYITLDWVERQLGPFPDFSINRQCRDWEAILRWLQENGVSRTETQALRAPEGHMGVPMSSEFLRLFEVEGWDVGDHSHPDEELD